MRRLLPLLIALLLLPAVLSGCFHLKQKLILNADLSGELHLTIAFPLDMVIEATAMAEGMEDPEAPARDREIIAAEVRANIEAGKAPDGTPNESVDAGDLPDGMTLLGQDFGLVGDNTELTIRLGFDHIDRLLEARELPIDDGKSLGELVGPITVTQKGRKLTLSGQPLQMGELTSGSMNKEEADMAAAMFGDGSFTFELQTPMKVTKAGSGTVDGDTVRWTYDIAGLLDPANRDIAVSMVGAKPAKKAKKPKAGKKPKKGKKAKKDADSDAGGSSDKTGI